MTRRRGDAEMGRKNQAWTRLLKTTSPRPHVPASARSRVPVSPRRRVSASPRLCLLVWFVAASLLFVACEREKREVRQATPGARTESIAVSDLQPGGSGVEMQTKNPAEEHAYDLSQGKQLYQSYNCAGCHFNGGGGIGPPLMDDTWIYGSDPSNIYATIIEGRPNGMPSFRNKIPDAEVWQLVGFVRSLSGQVQKDVSPTRSDHLNAKPSEQRTQQMKPKDSTPPPETK